MLANLAVGRRWAGFVRDAGVVSYNPLGAHQIETVAHAEMVMGAGLDDTMLAFDKFFLSHLALWLPRHEAGVLFCPGWRNSAGCKEEFDWAHDAHLGCFDADGASPDDVRAWLHGDPEAAE